MCVCLSVLGASVAKSGRRPLDMGHHLHCTVFSPTTSVTALLVNGGHTLHGLLKKKISKQSKTPGIPMVR